MRWLVLLCLLSVVVAGCGARLATGGGAGSEKQKLENACVKAWKQVLGAESGLHAAARIHQSGNPELPRANVEKIGEPAGEASSAWTTASEVARSLGYASLAGVMARAASDYGEVQFDLSPEGGGYEATEKVLSQASAADSEVARAAREHGLSACAGPAAG